jgi:hypothetical protein
MTIEREEYEQWRENAVTRWFLAAMRAYAEDCKTDAIAKFWGAGDANAETLAKLRGQAFSALYFADAKHEEIEKYHEERK